MKPPVNPPTPAIAPKHGQGFVLEGLDHFINVISLTTIVNY